MKVKKIAVVCGAGVLVVGMGLTLRDYKQWRYEETKNFGHGPIERLEKPKELRKRWENKVAKMRMLYPEGWQVSDNKFFRWDEKKPERSWREIARYDQTVEVARIQAGEGVVMTIDMKRLREEGMGTWENEVKRLEAKGVVFSQDREYWNTEKENWMVLTWKEEEKIVKLAMAVEEGRWVTVKSVIPGDRLEAEIRTIEEVVKSVNLL